MPETWQCGHCPLQVAIPDKDTNHDGYIDTIVLIREHRFGHIAEAFMKGTTEAIMDLVDDDPHSLLNGGPVVSCVGDPNLVVGPDPTTYGRRCKRCGVPQGVIETTTEPIHCRHEGSCTDLDDYHACYGHVLVSPVSKDDVIPALAEADRLVRGKR